MLDVAVIGAGVAGISVATRLALDGHHVHLFDEAPQICSGASGNRVGAFHAHVSRDDAPLSRLSRHGVAATLSSLRKLTASGLLVQGRDWDACGHIQLCESEKAASRLKETCDILTQQQIAVQWKATEQIAGELGLRTHQPGLYFEEAGWVIPKAWCEAQISFVRQTLSTQTSGMVGSLHVHLSHVVKPLHIDESGQCEIHGYAFDRVVVAAALHSLDIWPQTHTEARGVKGQVSVVHMEHHLPKVVSGAAYAIQMDSREWLIGATFERPALDCEVTQTGHEHNMARLQDAFPDLQIGEVKEGRSAIRAMWPDRIPAIGPAVDEYGAESTQVWFATGYGSRGLTWAALAADIIAAQWAGQPCPLPQDLLAAVLPGRFFSRASNSKPTLPSLPKTR